MEMLDICKGRKGPVGKPVVAVTIGLSIADI